jgi:hypothetical protein
MSVEAPSGATSVGSVSGVGLGEGMGSKGTALGSVAEKSAPSLSSIAPQGDLFSPSLNKDIFSQTVPATTFPVVEDRQIMSKSVFRDTVPIVSAKAQGKLSSLPREGVIFEVPKAFDDAFKEDVKEPEIELDPIEHRVDTEPQLENVIKEEARIASNVRGLLVEVGVPEAKAEKIASKALVEALAKRGVRVETLQKEKTKPETEQEEKLKEKEEKKVKDNKDDDRKEKKPIDEKKEEEKFVRDEYADEARRKDANRAVEKVFEDEREVKTGEEIASNMNERPDVNEMSELALNVKQDDDGSYQEILKELRGMQFESKKDAKERIEKLIEEKPAVKSGNGKIVEKKDVSRVLRSLRNILSDPWSVQMERKLGAL